MTTTMVVGLWLAIDQNGEPARAMCALQSAGIARQHAQTHTGARHGTHVCCNATTIVVALFDVVYWKMNGTDRINRIGSS
jgi:hypothetical protein